MDFEDILLTVGDGGRYQKGLILLFLIPSNILLPLYTVNIMFMVSVPDHWCYVPEVAASNLSLAEQRQLVSAVGDPKCSMYDVNYTQYLESGIYKVVNATGTKSCENGWQHETTHWDLTAATQWNMFCQDGHYVSLVLTLSYIGSILATPIYGFLSDKIGRRITFFIVLAITVVTSFASLFVTDFSAFVVLRTINGGVMPSLFQIPFIIVVELVAPEMRTHMSGFTNLAWTCGLSLLPLLAYLSRSWVTLGLITSFIMLPLFLYWPYLPESPRWLVSQEKYEEAAKIMMEIGEKNKKSTDLKVLTSRLEMLGEKMKKEKEKSEQASSMDLLRYPRLRKTFLILTLCWVANLMVYYGLQMNVANLAGNEFINFFLTAIVELPAYLLAWILMEKMGRRWPCVGGFFFTGIACMLPLVDSDVPYVDIASSMLGKFFSSCTFMAMYQQGSELYPTVIRSLGMGMSHTISMAASIATPYIIYLAVYGKSLPYIILGTSSIIAAAAASFLPETMNENLPQTIVDTENFGKNQKYFSWNKRRRSVSRERAASTATQLKGQYTPSTKDSNETQNISSITTQNGEKK